MLLSLDNITACDCEDRESTVSSNQANKYGPRVEVPIKVDQTRVLGFVVVCDCEFVCYGIARCWQVADVLEATVAIVAAIAPVAVIVIAVTTGSTGGTVAE